MYKRQAINLVSKFKQCGTYADFTVLAWHCREASYICDDQRLERLLLECAEVFESSFDPKTRILKQGGSR